VQRLPNPIFRFNHSLGKTRITGYCIADFYCHQCATAQWILQLFNNSVAPVSSAHSNTLSTGSFCY